MDNQNNTGKSVFITGANGGLGKETTRIVIQNGYDRVVMACRTETKAIEAKNDILESITPSHNTTIETVGGFDMNTPDAIESAVEVLPADKPFDVIFLQSGGVIFSDDYNYIDWNGKKVEKTIFQNVIGAYITLSNLKKRGLIAENARVVFAGGEGARGIPGLIESPKFETTEQLRQYIFGDKAGLKAYNPMNAIGVSKLMSALLSMKLAELEGERVSSIWFSPGLTYGTNGLATQPKLKRWFMEKVMFGLMAALGKAQSPFAGAKKYVDSLEGRIGVNGDVIGAPKGTALGKLVDQKPMNPAFTNLRLREEFWDILQDIYKPYGA